jgi:hypothetical protein
VIFNNIISWQMLICKLLPPKWGINFL